MAGDWIKMRTALAHDPAVIAIAIDLDKSEFEVVGMLHHLWSWADSQSQDGHIKRVTEVWIDRYVHHTGFAQSMVAAGWLLIEETGITFPSFEKHNGESAKKRAEAAERQRISRENKRLGIVTDVSQDSCDKSVTREEKRREEKSKEDQDQNTTAVKRRNWIVELVGLGVKENHAIDWLEVRKAKKAKMTDTALAGVQREAEKAGVTFGEAIRICAERSWQGFNASWLDKPGQQASGYMTKQERVEAANQKVLLEMNAAADANLKSLSGGAVRRDEEGFVIEGDFFHAT